MSSDAVAYEQVIPSLGRLQLRPLRNPEDIPTVHAWVGQPYAHYWGLVGKSAAEVAIAYRDIARNAQVFLGLLDGAPCFLLETYWPGDDPVGALYDVQTSDRGLHLLVAPPEAPRAGFTWSVFRTVMDFVFADPAVARVVVEPDIRNGKIHALNRRAGFRYQRPVTLPTKIGHLAFCTRAQYAAARDMPPSSQLAPIQDPSHCAHLTGASSAHWTAATAHLVRKCLAEFAHERLIEPALEREDGAWGHYRLAIEAGDVAYRFRARRLALDHWDLDPDSLVKTAAGAPAPLDALQLVIELGPQLSIDPAVLPVYLEEITATLASGAFKRSHQRHGAADLVHGRYQEIEAAMLEGHPSFVANSGRVGFDAADTLAYAPESGAPIRLVWLAAHRRHTQFTAVTGLTAEALIAGELDPETRDRFQRMLRDQGRDPGDYLLLPVHPWQWWNKLAILFAPDLAAGDLICLGAGPDSYQAQQSIRTLFNTSHPQRRLVKTALSVLNMGFMRGLSAEYMQGTPAINQHLAALVDGDGEFARRGFSLLREEAAIGYRNPRFEAALPRSSPYRKMLAALWRDSPAARLAPGQRLMTMAALLHVDRDGVALLPQLIAASGLDTDSWLARYFDSYLAPLLHCFYAYDLAFMPHGENLILVLQDQVVVRALLKDIAEEAVVMDPDSPATRDMPPEVRRLCAPVPEPLRLLSIFTDVFDGFFRYLAQVLLQHADYPEARFWAQVAACARGYQQAHPQLATRFARYDLFAPTFQRSCLNRLQLRNNRQMIDLTDPTSQLRFAGTLDNPIARYRPGPS